MGLQSAFLPLFYTLTYPPSGRRLPAGPRSKLTLMIYFMDGPPRIRPLGIRRRLQAGKPCAAPRSRAGDVRRLD
jgi:hypothetical protein